VGTTYSALERTTGARVVSVNRYGEGMLINAATVIQDDDIVHIATEAAGIARLRALIASGPEGA
jgi:trk system potassium uptake protein TrkA